MIIKMLALLALLIVFCCLPMANAQVLVDDKALIRFDHGLGFNAPDTAFGVNIRFRVQNRLNLTSVSDKDLSVQNIEAKANRLRLRFDGYIMGSRLTYLFQLGFSRDDVSGNPSGAPNLIRDAIVFYRLNPKIYFGFGQAKLPGNRQEMISSGQQQFIDRSVLTAAFDLNRDFGFFAYYNQKKTTVPFNIKTAISTGEGRNYNNNDAGLCYTGRLEVMPLGLFQNNGDFSEGDLAREQTPKLSVAASYSFNDEAVRTNGQTGALLFEPRDLQSWFGDVLLKFKGNSLFIEYGKRSCANPLTTDGEAFSIVQTGQAINLQISHLNRNNFEFVFRFADLNTDKLVRLDYPRQKFYTAGINKYLRDHMTKVQANVTYRQNNIDHTLLTNHLFLQLQIELGI